MTVKVAVSYWSAIGAVHALTQAVAEAATGPGYGCGCGRSPNWHPTGRRKIKQIFEGTNQIQRLVIVRSPAED